jgi:hypothetical protein
MNGEDLRHLLKVREDIARAMKDTRFPHLNRWGGYDVALVIDGSYANPANARRNADDFKRQIDAALAADGMPYGVPLNPETGRPQLVDAAIEEVP